jgi:hypothetical protein
LLGLGLWLLEGLLLGLCEGLALLDGLADLDGLALALRDRLADGDVVCRCAASSLAEAAAMDPLPQGEFT